MNAIRISLMSSLFSFTGHTLLCTIVNHTQNLDSITLSLKYVPTHSILFHKWFLTCHCPKLKIPEFLLQKKCYLKLTFDWLAIMDIFLCMWTVSNLIKSAVIDITLGRPMSIPWRLRSNSSRMTKVSVCHCSPWISTSIEALKNCLLDKWQKYTLSGVFGSDSVFRSFPFWLKATSLSLLIWIAETLLTVVVTLEYPLMALTFLWYNLKTWLILCGSN